MKHLEISVIEIKNCVHFNTKQLYSIREMEFIRQVSVKLMQ